MSDYMEVDTSGLERLEKTIKQMGGLPTKISVKAAGKAATVVRRSVRAKIPRGETGELARGIIRKSERSRLKGKKVYDLMFDPAKNAIFQKPVKKPGSAGSSSTRQGYAYYPVSQNAGFRTRSKGRGLPYVPGYHFMEQGLAEAEAEASQAAIDTAVAEIDKEWTK